MRPLAGLDAAFLYAETRSAPMNVIATLVVAGRIDCEALRERVRARLPQLPAFRRRLVDLPLGLAHPVWIEAQGLDLRAHVTRARVPDPEAEGALEEVVAGLARQRLDRSRPLWQITLVEGLSEERSALVVKAHHAALDGVSGAALLLHLFDRPGEESAASAPIDAWAPEPEPSAAALLGHALGQLRDRPRVWWQATRRTSRSAAELARARLGDVALREVALPFQAPDSPFNGPLSARRSVGYARSSLESARSVRAAVGGTVNDVVLAACTRALRAELIERGARPERPLVAAVPVSTRRPEDPADCGNRISAFLTRLPVQLEDPLHQLSEVARATRGAKQLHGVFGAETLASLAELSAPLLAQRAVRLYTRWGLAASHRPLFNLVISNLCGPPGSLTLLGRPVRALHPHGPLMEGVGLNVTVMSYAGAIDVGVLACRERVPGAQRLAGRVAEALEELARLAEASLPDAPPLARQVA